MLGLEFVCIFKSEFFDFSLAVRARLPAYLRAFVTADMDVFGREEFAHFCKDILEEEHCLLFSGTENVVCDTPSAPDFIWAACTAIFRICCEGCKHMSRKVDFRNNGDAFRCRICNNLLYILLRIPAALAVACVVVFASLEQVTDEGLVSDRADFCQARVFLYFKSPALVICKMPMKGVEFVDFHDVKISLYLILVEEVARHIHMHASVSESRSIIDFRALDGPICIGSLGLSKNLLWEHLLEGLDGIVHSIERRCIYLYCIFCHHKLICLFGHFRVHLEDESFAGRSFRNYVVAARNKRQLSCKAFHDCTSGLVKVSIIMEICSICIEHSVYDSYLIWIRYYVDCLCFRCAAG